MAGDELQTTRPGLTTEEVIAGMESRHPGFAAAVDAARARLYAEHPDLEERERFILAHFVRMECNDGE